MSVLIENLIKESIQRTKLASRDRLAMEHRDLNSAYHGNMREIINRELVSIKKYKHADLLMRDFDFLNFIKPIINRKATVYIEPPKRTLFEDEGGSELLNDVYSDSNIDIYYKEANRLSGLHKTVVFQVGFKEEGLTYTILDASNVFPYFSRNTHLPTGYVVKIDNLDNPNSQEPFFEGWTADSVMIFDSNGVMRPDLLPADNPTGINPFKILPFVPIFDTVPQPGMFWQDGWEQLYHSQMVINIALTFINHNFPIAATSQLVGKNIENLSIDWDPTKMAEIKSAVGQDADLSFLSQGFENIAKAWTFLQEKIQMLCLLEDLSPNMFKVTAQPASGISLQIENLPLERATVDMKTFYRGYEQKIYDVVSVIYNTYTDGPLLPKGKLMIDFADIKVVTDEKAVLEIDEKYIAMGVRSVVDVYQRLNPDLSEQDAIKAIKKNQEINRALMGKTTQGSLNEILNSSKADKLLEPEEADAESERT